MKKALLIALSLFATGEALKASPQFVLTQNSAGNLIFQGLGTAQYNNSIGTDNSFQVGSNTNLGVNASTSSTPEYKVQSHAQLDLASSTNIRQIIGTSSAVDTQTSRTTEKLNWASQQADSAVSTWEDSHGSSYQDHYNNFSKNSGYSGPDYASEDQWKNARSEVRTNSFNENYEMANTAISNSSVDLAKSGIIKGTFTTTESGSSASGSSVSEVIEDAQGKANDDIRDSFNTDYTNFLANDVDTNNVALATYADEAEYNAARSSAWTTAYNNHYADSILSTERTSESDVTVFGIGSDANVTSRDSSTFDVFIETRGEYYESAVAAGDAGAIGTADGAAGANLTTTSFANQSIANTASAFMQSFGVNQVGYQDAGQGMSQASSTQANGDSIENQINQIYNDLFGHDADANGLSYWSTQVENGMDPSDVAEAIASAK